jgi:hypothetical protein
MSDFGWWGGYTKEEAMKVQRKVSAGVQYEVIEEAPSYYIVKDILGTGVVPKTEYEPVQEWVDVTHECSIVFTHGIRGSIVYNGCLIYSDNGDYRLKATGSHGIRVERKQA